MIIIIGTYYSYGQYSTRLSMRDGGYEGMELHCFITLTQTRIGEEKNYLSAGLVNAVRKADSKLVFIPMVFVLLRAWGTMQFFYTVTVHLTPITESPHRCYCVSPAYYKGLVFLGVMQVRRTCKHRHCTYIIGQGNWVKGQMLFP